MFYARTLEENNACNIALTDFLEKKEAEEEGDAMADEMFDKELGNQKESVDNHQKGIYGEVHKRSSHATMRRYAMKARRHRWNWMNDGDRGADYRRAKAAGGCTYISPIGCRTERWEPRDKWSNPCNETLVKPCEVNQLFLSHLMDDCGPPSENEQELPDGPGKTMLMIASIGCSLCDYIELSKKLASPDVKGTEKWMWNQLLEGLKVVQMANDEGERYRTELSKHWKILVDAWKETRKDLGKPHIRPELVPSEKTGSKAECNQPKGRSGVSCSAKATKGDRKRNDRSASATGRSWNGTWSSSWATGAVWAGSSWSARGMEVVAVQHAEFDDFGIATCVNAHHSLWWFFAVALVCLVTIVSVVCFAAGWTLSQKWH